MNCMCGRYDCESCNQYMQEMEMQNEIHWAYQEALKDRSLFRLIFDWFSVRRRKPVTTIPDRPDDEIPF